MPTIDAFIVAAIVTVFVIFAVVLAWAEYQTAALTASGSTRRCRHKAPSGHYPCEGRVTRNNRAMPTLPSTLRRANRPTGDPDRFVFATTSGYPANLK